MDYNEYKDIFQDGLRFAQFRVIFDTLLTFGGISSIILFE